MYHDPKPIAAQPVCPDDLQRGDVVQFRFPLALRLNPVAG
mgnify:CR=1 FL=1